ncbi:putative 26S proteasome regulatory subunit [Cystobasidiomycetes sp. EMM_F5]
MDAAQAREAALELIKSKDAKELELGQLHEALQSQNAELGQSLIDPEGFPRGDIDVHNVRLTRVRVIELRNDIKAISEKIKELLEVALARPPPSESKASTSSAREEAAPLPFALCNGVAPGSPAATAGLRRGDKFVRFGSIKFDNHDTLRAVAAEVQQNENGYVQEDTEAEGPSQFSTRIRRVNKRKIATWVGKTANTDFYHGQQLRYLHFQITQILLRRQTQQLMILWDLPIEFEVRSTSSVNIWSKLKVVTQMIVRDLWAMYISLTDLEAEPYKDVDDRGSRDGSSPDKEAAPEYHDPLAALYNALSDSASSTDSEPDATSDKSTRSESPKKSTGEATSGYGNYTSKSTRKPRKPFDPSRRLQMHYTLVICYLACLTLRLPVLMRDLLDLAASHKIAYLDILAQVPEDMRKHLETVRTADFIEDVRVEALCSNVVHI